MSPHLLWRRPTLAAAALLVLLPACDVQFLEALDAPDTANGACFGATPPSSTCPDDPPDPGAVCGNGRLEGMEQCDDGNLRDGDGCAADCRLEPGTNPSPVCGNGVLEGTEQCDDGNLRDGDGCTSDCRLDPDPGACGCVDEAISWGSIGGWSPLEPLSTLSPCSTFSHEEYPVGRKEPTSSCSQELAGCEQGVSAGDVAEALAHPDVAAAMAAAPVLYGTDGRLVDGVLRRLTLHKAVIDVGYDCGTAPGCVPIPEGVAALIDTLERLEDEQLALGPCSEVFAR